MTEAQANWAGFKSARKTTRIPKQDAAPVFAWAWKVANLVPDLAPVPEYQFMPDRRFRFDWAFVAHKVGIEVDGGLWLRVGHAHPGNILKEMVKFNFAAAAGWRVFRFTPEMLRADPVACCELVRQALQR